MMLLDYLDDVRWTILLLPGSGRRGEAYRSLAATSIGAVPPPDPCRLSARRPPAVDDIRRPAVHRGRLVGAQEGRRPATSSGSIRRLDRGRFRASPAERRRPAARASVLAKDLDLPLDMSVRRMQDRRRLTMTPRRTRLERDRFRRPRPDRAWRPRRLTYSAGPIKPLMLAMFTMRPQPRSYMPGITARISIAGAMR